MNLQKYALDFAITFMIVLVVNMIVTAAYSFFIHGITIIEWESSIRFAILFGIVMPWLHQRAEKSAKR
ncbi:MAG TPA: hypothetical protein VK470_04050 [Bacteroidota bacterium]|nr:hypothetical protein [Bacteroidota bacterium]